MYIVSEGCNELIESRKESRFQGYLILTDKGQQIRIPVEIPSIILLHRQNAP